MSESNKPFRAANQKYIEIRKQQCTAEGLYACIDMTALKKAAQGLNAGAFKLWVYFSKNQNGYRFNLSSKDARETFGLKKSQYDKAVNELIEKGYLEPIQEGKNNFYFNELVEDMQQPLSEDKTTCSHIIEQGIYNTPNNSSKNMPIALDSSYDKDLFDDMTTAYREKDSSLNGEQTRNNTYSTKDITDDSTASILPIDYRFLEKHEGNPRGEVQGFKF